MNEMKVFYDLINRKNGNLLNYIYLYMKV